MILSCGNCGRATQHLNNKCMDCSEHVGTPTPEEMDARIKRSIESGVSSATFQEVIDGLTESIRDMGEAFGTAARHMRPALAELQRELEYPGGNRLPRGKRDYR